MISTPVAWNELPQAWTPPPATPLDEAVWRAWVREGREREKWSRAALIDAVKWISVAALLVGAAEMWSHLAPYDVVVRFIAAAGALVVMSLASAVPFAASLAWCNGNPVHNA